MGIRDEILYGIYSYGYRMPSPIQKRGIPVVVQGRNVILQSQSGSGKTCVFCVGALNRIQELDRSPQALIISPTRELAEQNGRICSALSDFMGIKVVCCCGQKKVNDEAAILRMGPHIISGTPGRILHLIRGRLIPVQSIKMLILDEVDEILSMGLREQISKIHESLKEGVQVVVASATMDEEVLDIIGELTGSNTPFRILVRPQKVAVRDTKQFCVNVKEERWKLDALFDLYSLLSVTQSVIFCNTKAKVEWLAKKLETSFSMVGRIHGDMSQKDREKAAHAFRTGTHRIMVATDVFGRGIDVPGVSMIVNFDVPKRPEFYIHRIGRSGRFGRKGLSITLQTTTEKKLMQDIMRTYKINIPALPSRKLAANVI
eukprot:GHVO01040994.1.p1 GENE.GHVO01040994.1~~GHVO01040994.1.p1  ORF type:complete len:398 (-),score=52.04 GHVO01040994.1:51-1172(-)